jgi:hypothetical protein
VACLTTEELPWVPQENASSCTAVVARQLYWRKVRLDESRKHLVISARHEICLVSILLMSVTRKQKGKQRKAVYGTAGLWLAYGTQSLIVCNVPSEEHWRSVAVDDTWWWYAGVSKYGVAAELLKVSTERTCYRTNGRTRTEGSSCASLARQRSPSSILPPWTCSSSWAF